MPSPTEQDERELVQRAQADPARFLALYDLYFHRVWSYVRGRASGRAEAEDITSEVFRRALEALPGYEWRGVPFAAWLLRIAANTLSHRWEKAARESAGPPPETAAPDDGLERRAMLFQLVSRLPEEQRQVIELRYVEQRSLAETAGSLGKSEGAIKQLQRRALERLRAEWEAGHA
jgi:RNA polymerase sigma-70 factor (ECF subfamily)